MDDFAPESPWNIGFVCEKHKARPVRKLIERARKDPQSFVGRYIKMAFPAPLLGPDGQEHMWVKVESFKKGTGKRSRTWFTGRIWNDPQFSDLLFQTSVDFTPTEIEGLLEEQT
jgi:hypothetical protein